MRNVEIATEGASPDAPGFCPADKSAGYESSAEPSRTIRASWLHGDTRALACVDSVSSAPRQFVGMREGRAL